MDLKEIQKQIDDMSKSVEEPMAGEDLSTTAPGTTSPSTESVSTEAPGTSAPGTSAPSTEAPVEDPRDAELRKLREELEDLKKAKVTTSAPSTKAPSTEAPLGEEDFLGDIDLDDLTRDKDMFNKVLNKVFMKGVEIGKTYIQSTSERLVRSIPDITQNTIEVTRRLAEVNKKFYEDNQDLVPWKTAVASVFEEMSSANPEKRYDELLPDVAIEVRKRIGLQKSATNQTKNDPPPLPHKKGGQRSTTKPDTDEFVSDLDAMEKALGLK